MQTIGEIIKTTRESIGMTQQELASLTNEVFKNEKVTISRRHLSNVEIGQSSFALDKLNAVISVLTSLNKRLVK